MRQISPNTDIFLAIFAKSGIFILDALTTARASTLRAATRLFLASNAGQGDATMKKASLATTVLSFAFSGMLPSHRREYEAPRTVSQPTSQKK